MFDNGDVALGVGNEEVLGNGARDVLESVEGLARGMAMLSDVADKVGGREAVGPSVDVGVGETDVEAVFVDGVLGVEFAGVFAEVAAPDAFVGEDEVAITADEIEVVLFEEFAGGGFPVVVAADESFALFVEGEDSAAVGVLVDAAFLAVDERGEVFVEEEIGVDADGFGGGGDF